MSNPRRSNSTTRNRIRAIVLNEEDTCHLCGGPVNKRLTHGLPGSPEVDELIPVAHGGDPLKRTNCRLAHRWCNRKRGTVPVATAQQLIATNPPHFTNDGHKQDTTPTPVISRQW